VTVIFNILMIAIVSCIAYFPIKIISIRYMPKNKSVAEKVRNAKIVTAGLFCSFSFFSILEYFGYF